MSLIGALTRPSAKAGQPPIPFASRASQFARGFFRPGGMEAQMNAMGSIGTLFAIVNRTSTSVAALNWRLWKTAKSGKKEDRTEVTSHACIDLWNKPNTYYTRQELVESAQQHIDLTGEGWLVIARDPRSSLPLELWCARPDRMDIQKSPEDFLTGYWYLGPDGENVPLAKNQVMQLRMPNPMDPYRGMGPVQSIMTDLEATRYAAEWNRAFFLNSAEPGGIIEIDRRLSDDEFDELRKRWAEQHQGTSQAHRVAILEQVKWVDRKYTMRDMQFSELRGVSRDVIREAFAMNKFALGDVDDVNRATADASKAVFAEWTTVPRADRWKAMLNNDLLPLYGTSASGLEWDYDDPIPANAEAENAELTAKVGAVASLVPLGADFTDAMRAFGLPEIKWEKPEPAAPPQAFPGTKPPAGALGGRPGVPAGGKPKSAWESLTAQLLDAAPPIDPELAQVQADFEAALTQLEADWAKQVTPAQLEEIRAQVEAAVDDGDLSALAGMTVGTSGAAALLLFALTGLATVSATQMAAGLAAQGAPLVAPVVPAVAALTAVADAAAGILGAGLAASAAAEALRLATPGATAVAVGAGVVAWLRGLSGRGLRDQLSSALTRAQNEARLLTVEHVPQVIYSSSEVLDTSTCIRCREINGHEYPSWKAAWDDYAGGTYKHCLGRWRCRGTVVARWNPEAGDL